MSGWVNDLALGLLLTFNCWRISVLTSSVKTLLEIVPDGKKPRRQIRDPQQRDYDQMDAKTQGGKR